MQSQMKKIKLLILGSVLPSLMFCQQWYSMDGGVNSPSHPPYVFTINAFQGNIIIGGQFKTSGSTILNSVGKWDGQHWKPMGIGAWLPSPNQDADVANFPFYKSKLYIIGYILGAGGSFVGDTTHRVGDIAKWNGSDWFPLCSNPIYSGFDFFAYSSSIYNNNLYIGGDFQQTIDSSGALYSQGIARWNDTVFSSPGIMTTNHVLGMPSLWALKVYNNKLIAGGAFNSIDGSTYGSYSFIAAWDDTSWSPLSTGLNAPVHSLTVYNGELYAGGAFTATGDNLTPLNHVAKWNGTQWLAVGEGLNDSVYTLQNKLYAGGSFTQTGLGIQAKRIAEWTGSNWQEVGGGTNNDVWALYAKDSNLYVGGYFSQVGGSVPASCIAVWGNNPVGINEINNYEEINIYPIPTTGIFTIHSEGMKIKQIKITNILGEVIKNINNTTIDLSDQPKGIYFVEIKTDKGTTNKKIILQ